MRLLPEALFALFGIALTRAALLENLAEPIGLLLLLIGELIGLIGHLTHTAGILLALQRAQSFGGFAEAIRRAACIGSALLLGSRAVEGVGGLAERIESALDARIGGLLRLAAALSLRLSGLARLATGLAR